MALVAFAGAAIAGGLQARRSTRTLGRSTMLTPLEQAVIDILLDKQGEPFDTIRQQLSHATIAERRFTGAGFFTDFIIPADAPARRDLADMTIGGVGAEFPGMQHGAGFLLFVRAGVVSMLEGYTYDESWPASTDEFTLHRHQAA